ncbi:hypothetical protein F5Y10DRAFT_229405 [Nemania abortiva]|nr:hypothetical protein F5Y10DRAFT_229405 [Nemania abortiva]
MPPLPPPTSVARSSPALPNHPTRLRHSIPKFETPGALRPRILVGAVTVPQGYGNTPFGPDSGTVAGIVLGSVAGFLLFLALLYWCVNIGQGPRMREEGSVGGATASVVSWTSRPRGPPRKHRRSKRGSRREKVEIRRERTVPVRIEREDQIVVEEFQSRSRSRPRSVSRGPSPPRRVRADGDDMIIVEEDPPSPRRRRDSTRRSDDRRGSFREDVYMRDVSRQRSRSRA